MKTARLAVLGVALLAGGGAAYLATGSPPPVPVEAAPPPVLHTTDILIAARDVPLGTVLKRDELRWQPWPQDGVSAAMIKRGETPGAAEELTGAIARMPMLEGEPIRREKLVKADGSGFMAAVLPKGKRALAITIDQRGTATAGGFILPNDRVDVVRTIRDEAASRAAGSDVFASETILQNVRILAIGQNVQERNGEKVVVGETATLELDPVQVETVALAQRTGQLSLSLRSLVDNSEPPEAVRNNNGPMTIVRFGIPSAAGQR